MANEETAGKGAAGAGAGAGNGGKDGAAGAGAGAAGQNGSGAGAQGGAAAGHGAAQGSLLGGAKSPEAKAAGEKAGAEKVAAEKAAAEAQAALDKELEGKNEAQKAEILKKREDAKKADEAWAQASPEKYEIKLAEGFKPLPAAMEKFESLAKKMGLSQAKAQSLADLQIEMETARINEVAGEFLKMAEGWKGETQKAYGPNFAEAETNAGRAIEWAEGKGIKGIRELMDETFVGNRLPMFQLFDLIGKALAEDKLHIPGGQGGKDGRTPGQRFYDPAGSRS